MTATSGAASAQRRPSTPEPEPESQRGVRGSRPAPGPGQVSRASAGVSIHAATSAGPPPRAVTQLAAHASARRSAAASTATPSLVLARLDAHRKSYAGPYQVDGKQIRVDAHFRMNGGFGANPTQALARAKRALSPQDFDRLHLQIARVATGKSSAEGLVQLTQALIDRGLHKPFGAGPAAVRRMMWEYGIGIDCSGYTRGAFLAARGLSDAQGRARYALPGTHFGFDPDRLNQFRKVEPTLVKAGDMCKLVHGHESHKVIVASHDVVPASARPVHVPGHGDLPTEFGANGRVHIYQVDSSWGAGPNGSEHGGVGRRVWVYSESTQRWGSFDVGSGKLRVSSAGPYGSDLLGFYRPKSER